MAVVPAIPDALYIGATAVDRVYQGPVKVFQRPVPLTPYAEAVLNLGGVFCQDGVTDVIGGESFPNASGDQELPGVDGVKSVQGLDTGQEELLLASPVDSFTDYTVVGLIKHTGGNTGAIDYGWFRNATNEAVGVRGSWATGPRMHYEANQSNQGLIKWSNQSPVYWGFFCIRVQQGVSQQAEIWKTDPDYIWQSWSDPAQTTTRGIDRMKIQSRGSGREMAGWSVIPSVISDAERDELLSYFPSIPTQ